MVHSGDPVLPEIGLIEEIPILLVCDDDDDSICSQLPEDRYPRLVVKGAHRLDGKFSAIAEEILLRLSRVGNNDK
jgi:type IV secretory pathway VirJ component